MHSSIDEALNYGLNEPSASRGVLLLTTSTRRVWVYLSASCLRFAMKQRESLTWLKELALVVNYLFHRPGNRTAVVLEARRSNLQNLSRSRPLAAHLAMPGRFFDEGRQFVNGCKLLTNKSATMFVPARPWAWHFVRPNLGPQLVVKGPYKALKVLIRPQRAL